MSQRIELGSLVQIKLTSTRAVVKAMALGNEEIMYSLHCEATGLFLGVYPESSIAPVIYQHFGANGLYLINWKNGGGCSLASVGTTTDGTRWFAPTNWVNWRPLSCWDNVESLELICAELSNCVSLANLE